MSSAPPPVALKATITSGTSLSDAVPLHGAGTGFYMPSGWTTAAITFQASQDGQTFYDMYDSAQTTTAVERTIASGNAVTGRFFAFSLNDWLGANWIKIRSGTSASPVNQGADRVITVIRSP